MWINYVLRYVQNAFFNANAHQEVCMKKAAFTLSIVIFSLLAAVFSCEILCHLALVQLYNERLKVVYDFIAKLCF